MSLIYEVCDGTATTISALRLRLSFSLQSNINKGKKINLHFCWTIYNSGTASFIIRINVFVHNYFGFTFVWFCSLGFTSVYFLLLLFTWIQLSSLWFTCLHLVGLVDLWELGYIGDLSEFSWPQTKEGDIEVRWSNKLKVQCESSHVFNLIFKWNTFQQIVSFNFVYPFYTYIQYMMSMIDYFYFYCKYSLFLSSHVFDLPFKRNIFQKQLESHSEWVNTLFLEENI